MWSPSNTEGAKPITHNRQAISTRSTLPADISQGQCQLDTATILHTRSASLADITPRQCQSESATTLQLLPARGTGLGPALFIRIYLAVLWTLGMNRDGRHLANQPINLLI